ncbi:TetR family transcriptional regulator [Streptomyces actuosus]|uniref:TetR family transcriptional regulator n=1 Tax=Streptomyces actuosus TaxID=1885 RepID=A0ABS2VKD6_STRAS|nr:TetR/AcrR family transcriptional regulator [Streptomyces actuosus]MBN0043563.1 TetR family transcriptional regulator [Streptomyces actuosus]
MARWEPNARVRLVRAALDLFAEQGYDATTVKEIADRAGLTKTTFFRHFPDKREVLFAGQDLHTRLLAEAIAEAPDRATPLEAVGAALDAVTAAFTEDRREFSAALRPVIAGHSELQERSALKRAKLAEAMTGALHERGVPEPAASLAAEIGLRAFDRAFEQWADPAGREALTDLTRRAFDELRAAMAALDQGRPAPRGERTPTA